MSSNLVKGVLEGEWTKLRQYFKEYYVTSDYGIVTNLILINENDKNMEKL